MSDTEFVEQMSAGDKARYVDQYFDTYGPAAAVALPQQDIPKKLEAVAKKVFLKHDVAEIWEWEFKLKQTYRLLYGLERTFNLSYVKPFANT